MFKFLICNHLFPNVQYESNIFVVKTIQNTEFEITLCKSQDLFVQIKYQIDILGKIILQLKKYKFEVSPFKDHLHSKNKKNYNLQKVNDIF
jgi:hypothetical protein